MAVLARLSRTIPLLAALAVLAGIVYLVVTYRSSPNRAKEVLIKLFTWLMGIQSVLFGLLTVYALAESNIGVAELWGTFMATAIIGLLITLVCKWRFKKNHPNYKFEASNPRAHVIPNLPWPLNVILSNIKFPWQK